MTEDILPTSGQNFACSSTSVASFLRAFMGVLLWEQNIHSFFLTAMQKQKSHQHLTLHKTNSDFIVENEK